MAETVHGSPIGAPRQVVHSPEQVALELPLAGPSSRILAYGVDYLLIGLVQIILYALAILAAVTVVDWEAWLESALEGFLGGGGSEPAAPVLLGLLVALVLLVDLVIQIVYFVGFEALNRGRSPGKTLLHLQVVRDGGLPLTARDALVRNLLRAVDVLPASYFVGFLAMVLSPQHKRLGDLVAGTVVVRHDRPGALGGEGRPPSAAARGRPAAAGDGEEASGGSDAAATVPPAEAAFRFERAQVARLGAPELRLLRQTLRRSGELPPPVAAAAMARTAEALCRRIGHPPLEPQRREPFLRALLRAAEEM